MDNVPGLISSDLGTTFSLRPEAPRPGSCDLVFIVQLLCNSDDHRYGIVASASASSYNIDQKTNTHDTTSRYHGPRHEWPHSIGQVRCGVDYRL